MKKEMDRKTLDYTSTAEYDAEHIKSLRAENEQLIDDLKLMTMAVSTRNAYIKKIEYAYAEYLKWRNT